MHVIMHQLLLSRYSYFKRSLQIEKPLSPHSRSFWTPRLFRQPIAVSDISIYICLIDIRSKSIEQLNERRAGLSRGFKVKHHCKISEPMCLSSSFS